MLAFLDKIPYGTPRIRRIAFWVMTTLICYTLFGFFAMPPIVKSVVLGQIDTALKRPAQIGDIYFNPFTLHIEVNDVHVNKLEGKGDLLSVKQMIAAPGIASVWEFAPVIAYLQLHDFTLDITFFGDGRYSISDLMGTPNPPEDDPTEETKPEEDTPVFPFALYGFEMTNAKIVFDDRPHHKKHVIDQMFLRVPFTSSFTDLSKEFTQPKFTAVVNGDPVELKGRTLPFDKSLLTEFELGAVDIDLDQYWKYVPIATPLKLRKGRFTSDISLFFERPDAQRMSLFLGGGGTLTDVELTDPLEGSVFKLDKLTFAMERFSLGDKALVLNSVQMDSPFFRVIRTEENSINWAGYFPGSGMEAEGPKIKTQSPEDAAFQLDIRHFEIKDGSLNWIDRKVPGEFRRIYRNFNFTGTELTTHGDRPSSFEASTETDGKITIKGVATVKPVSVEAIVTLEGAPLPAHKPYLDEVLPLEVDSGSLGLSADIDFTMLEDKPNVIMTNGTLSLTDFVARKPEAKEPSVSLKAFTISGASASLQESSATVEKVTVTGPAIEVVREKDGQIDLVSLFAGESEEPTLKPAPDPEPATVKPQWQAVIKQIIVEDGSATFRDLQPAHPATLGVRQFKLDLQNVSTEKGASMPYTASGIWIGRGGFWTGGSASMEPLKARGRLKLKNVGLTPFDGYLAEQTELLFAEGAASADLKYTFTGGEEPRYSATGDASLSSLRLKTTFDDDELAGIDEFKLVGIDFANAPNSLTIGEISLNGPRAYIEFDAENRMNTRRALRIPEPAPVPEDEEAENAKEVVAEAVVTVVKAEVDVAQEAEKAAESLPFFKKLDIGKISMSKGRVKFRDASVTPEFNTDIMDATLLLTGVNQTAEARPKIDFKAKIGPTPMSVTGVVNPVITPIYSDLAISVNGMELVPLTPYTIRSLAYPIEKGRLYADVTFKTEDWALDAQNKFFIEQLVLGSKDKRPDAPSVPVKFGLALLQDGNGDMQLNLPISGRLDDPNFRIGGIVFKAIVNMLFKALASPFTLIASMFGGGEDMDFVVFEPGRHTLDAGGEEKIGTIIKALTEREKLKLEVDGVIDPVADRNGLVQVFFEEKIKQQKYDSLSRKERAEMTLDDITVTPEEYPEFLFEAYADEEDEEGVRPTTLFMVDKQPVDVMEKFIRERIVITDQHLNDLALRRAGEIKDHIIARNPALTERIFLLDRREDRKGKVGVPAHRADLGID